MNFSEQPWRALLDQQVCDVKEEGLTFAFSASISFSATAAGSPMSSSLAIRTGVTVTPTVVDFRAGSCRRMLAPDLLVSFHADGYSI